VKSTRSRPLAVFACTSFETRSPTCISCPARIVCKTLGVGVRVDYSVRVSVHAKFELVDVVAVVAG
jgi:hypothetical protein